MKTGIMCAGRICIRQNVHNRKIDEEDTDMPVGEVIRRKRKEQGLTQEQVAQRLGVSAPAVNKWERGSSYPDIAILPALARLLNTDVNTLLCFQEELSDNEIAEICNKIAAIMEEQGLETAFDAAEQKVREYPNCGKLIHMMASMVQGLLMMSGGWSTDREKYEEKIYSWYERVTECGGDEQVKNAAAYMLASKYIMKKEYEKAQKMLDSLPKQQADKRILNARLLLAQEKHDEAAVLLERKLTDVLNDLSIVLFMLMDIAFREGDMERAEKIASAGEQTALLYDQWGYSPLLLPMDLALKKKDVEKSIAYIREMLRMLTEPQHMSESVFYCHLYGKENFGRKYDKAMETYVEKILPGLLAEMKTGKDYAFLQGNEEFQELIHIYEK